MKAAQEGDRSSFDHLVERHQSMVYGLVGRLVGDAETAADTTQDVFVKAFVGLRKFRGDAAFTTWLYRIALNQARSVLRRKRAPGPKVYQLFAKREGDDSRPEEVADETYEPTSMIERQETAELIQSVLHTLDPDDRELIVLRDVQGLGYHQISKVVGRPLGTIKSTLHRARLKFVERYRLVERGAAGAPDMSDRGVAG